MSSQERAREEERYEEEVNERDKWDKRAQRALVYINFESVNTTRMLFLKKQLHAFKKDASETITAYITCLKDLMDQLLSVEEYVSDVDMVSIAMNGLTVNEANSPWSQLVTSLMLRETTPCFEELSALLL